MKKLFTTAIAIMISASNVLAAEGDADKLAGSAMGLLYLVGGIFLLYALLSGVCAFGEWCGHIWDNSTTAGRLIIFGVPLSVMSTGVFYVLFYHVVPVIIHSLLPWLVHTIGGNVVCVLLIDLVCFLLGWTTFNKYNGAEGHDQRSGRVATVARFVVLLPFLPVIYIGYFSVQLFKKVCVKDAKISLNPYIIRQKPDTDCRNQRISSEELDRLTERELFFKERAGQTMEHYRPLITELNQIADQVAGDKDAAKDELLYDVAKWAIEIQGVSSSAIQRHFSVGYIRAGKIVDQLYELGVCSARHATTGARTVLITMAELNEMVKTGTFN